MKSMQSAVAYEAAPLNVDPTPPDERLRAILADLRVSLAGHPPASVLASLYEDLLPGVAAPVSLRVLVRLTMARVAEVMPRDQFLTIKLTNKIASNTTEKVLLLQAAIDLTSGHIEWLHQNLAVHLHQMVKAGQREALPPMLLHASTFLLSAAPNSPGLPFVRCLLAQYLMPHAPRSALIHAKQALDDGSFEGFGLVMQAARKLNVMPPDEERLGNISTVKLIEAACDLPRSSMFEAASTGDVGISPKRVIDASVVTIPPPRGDAFYYIFREAGQSITIPDISVYAIEEGVISFDLTHRGRPQFYVFDKNNICLEDLSSGVTPFIQPDLQNYTGDLGIVSDRFSSSMNVCHFLLDQFSRITLYDRFAPSGRILLASPYKQYLGILDRAGFADRVVVPVDKRFSIRADRLLVSSNIIEDLRHPGHLGAPWVIDFLRERLQPDTLPVHRRIFISRADATGRGIINWPEIEEVLSSHGFEVVNVSALSLNEQISTFSAAECVVGLHGAGLTNMVFSPPGTKILEILPPLVATRAYWVLANACRHDYHAMVADDPELPTPDYATWGHHPEFNSRDVIINRKRLDETLDTIFHNQHT